MYRSLYTLTKISPKRNEAIIINKINSRFLIIHGNEISIWKNLDGRKNLRIPSIFSKRLKQYEMTSQTGPHGGIFEDFNDVLFPVKWFVDVGYECNLRCKHCHNQFYEKNPSIDIIIKAIDQIVENGGMYISFGGGEPFLREDIFEILDYVESNPHIIFSVPTNSTYLTEDKVKKLSKYKRLHYLEVSLDGLEHSHNKQREKDCFKQVIKALEWCKKYGLRTKIMTVATQITYDDIFRMKDLVKKYSDTWKILRYVPQFKDDKLILTSIQEQNIFEFSRQAREPEFYVDVNCFDQDVFCDMARITASIYADGRVSPCGFIPQLVCGNINEKSLHDIVRDGWSFRAFRNINCPRCVAIQMYNPDEKPKRISEEFLAFK